MNSRGPSVAKIQHRKRGKKIGERVITRPPTRRSVVLDTDLRVVSSNPNQNREGKGPGVLRMSPGSPREDTVTFLFEMSLVKNVALRPAAKKNQDNPTSH